MASDRDIVELATTNSYVKYEVGEEIFVNNNSYKITNLFNSETGYKYGLDAMLVLDESNKYSLIFTGSDKRNDFFNDWVINNGSIALKKPVMQYEYGLKLVGEIENSGIEIDKIGGVSLGGGIASYIGVKRDDISIISVNPSPQITKYDGEHSNIKVIIDKNDLLDKVVTIANRKKYVPGKIYTFSRGNSFFEFRLNHKGDSKTDFRSLDDSFPFDLLTNNIQETLIDIDTSSVLDLNNSLNSRLENYKNEYQTQIYNKLSEIVASNIDTLDLERVFLRIVSDIDAYLLGCFPVLRNYVDFSYIFDFIKDQSHYISNSVIVDLIEQMFNSLNVNRFKKDVLEDSKNALINFDRTSTFFESAIRNTSNHIENFLNADNNNFNYSNPRFNVVSLNQKQIMYKISYFKYFDEAKTIVYYYINSVISTKFSVLDSKIDFYIAPVKEIVEFSSDVANLLNLEIKDKILTCKQILNEVYNFDIGDFFARLLLIMCDEIINLVIPIEIDTIVNKMKYFSGVIGNVVISHNNYISYLNEINSFSFKNISKINTEFNKKLVTYNNYLKFVYE